ncbi:hypothetical protein LTR10_017514 [Elasticomyces elasticus]|uniref:Heterokaryon incompatibility domain-containing protein n=1 Tax=Exophiala sideris TaxID=1016849 RepID=A0ABR0IZD6_9EURO|nr:hypothetical protein LTR10_017514 [Elasticomyces elasticus]KAK5023481.1 hypothetical protein LTS07_009356 [Exophiala sideris]KAK5028144.1 hypothetical protein LTR13_009132 [Exophiala sideris]KAK5052802.1 hypothetical protein LTR69_009628 [Exophiala sideris]KAK5178413.1 hypothetical protein LTR44_009038 [Eurotiomycetes sp. CCFEE 6388]
MDPDKPDLNIKVHRFDGSIRYTAISHVWSDGLGNPHENGLPHCQLQRIAGILKNMNEQSKRYFGIHEGQGGTPSILACCNNRGGKSRRVFFWMETLCIPVKARDEFDPSVEELKIRAIRHITPIFQAANHVLVLDKELEQLQLKSPDEDRMTPVQIVENEEILTSRILGSKWLQRAWTLEEGALARQLHFKVAGDRTVVLGDFSSREPRRDKIIEALRERYLKKKDKAARKAKGDIELGFQSSRRDLQTLSRVPNVPQFEDPLKQLLAGPMNESLKQASREDKGRMDEASFHRTRTTRFINAWNDLLLRSATKPDDPILIFANILNLNAAPIARIQPPEDRLAMIVKSLAEVPLSLLFNTGNSAHSNLHPKDAWIPVNIKGDRLAGASVLRMGNVDEDFPRLHINLSHADPPLVLLVRPKIQFHHRIVAIQFGSDKYVVEAAPSPEGLDPSDPWVARCQESYEEPGSDASLLLIDKGTGTTSLNGYVARGARFRVLSEEANEVLIRWDTAVKVWTDEQWRRRPRVPANPYSIDCDVIKETRRILLDHGKTFQMRSSKALPIAQSGPEPRTLDVSFDDVQGNPRRFGSGSPFSAS